MVYYTLVTLPFGAVALLWRLVAHSPLLIRVILPEEQHSALNLLQQSYPQARARTHTVINSICRQLAEYQQGKEINFSLLAMGPQHCSDFYRRVWMETSRIPSGRVCTYGDLAGRISHPRAARAVGTALAANPFPLLIPCHRVIRANGELGNYSAGGPAAKRRLLAGEGVLFDGRGRVLPSSRTSAQHLVKCNEVGEPE